MSGRPGSVVAVDFADAELTCWRAIGPQCLAVIERALAEQGDAAEPELIQLQHELNALCNPSPCIT